MGSLSRCARHWLTASTRRVSPRLQPRARGPTPTALLRLHLRLRLPSGARTRRSNQVMPGEGLPSRSHAQREVAAQISRRQITICFTRALPRLEKYRSARARPLFRPRLRLRLLSPTLLRTCLERHQQRAARLQQIFERCSRTPRPHLLEIPSAREVQRCGFRRIAQVLQLHQSRPRLRLLSPTLLRTCLERRQRLMTQQRRIRMHLDLSTGSRQQLRFPPTGRTGEERLAGPVNHKPQHSTIMFRALEHLHPNLTGRRQSVLHSASQLPSRILRLPQAPPRLPLASTGALWGRLHAAPARTRGPLRIIRIVHRSRAVSGRRDSRVSGEGCCMRPFLPQMEGRLSTDLRITPPVGRGGEKHTFHTRATL